jgi:type I site-specific restriction endonuclease
LVPQPEHQARENIDALLQAAGRHVCNASAANIHAARGVAIREFPLPGYGFADYLLYVDGKAAGVIEAKKEGVTLTGVETQSDKYTKGLPASLPRWGSPLPFSYQSTGIETRFTNGLDPTPRSRPVFAFHKPELLADWLGLASTTSPLDKRGPGGISPSQQARVVASKPLCDPALRQIILDIKAKNELTIDHVSQDQVIEAGFSQAALDRAKGLVQSFEQFIADHKDEITALQILYAKPYKQRLTFEAVKELADAIEKPPYLWNESQLWQAYAALQASKVKGASSKRILTDLVSLVRFAIHQNNELVPFPERVNANFKTWLATQQQRPSPSGRGAGGEGALIPLDKGGPGGISEGQRGATRFTPEQLKWLEMIRDHIAANLGIEPDDFEYAPFAQEGGLGKVYQLFGDELNTLIEQLNESLAA